MNCKPKLEDPLTHCTGSVTEIRSSTNTYCIFGKRRPSSSTSLSGEAEAPMRIVSRLRRSRPSHRLQTSEQASRLAFASSRRNISTINSSGRTPFITSNPLISPQFQYTFAAIDSFPTNCFSLQLRIASVYRMIVNRDVYTYIHVYI